MHALCQLLITCAAEYELLSGVRRCQDWLPGRGLSWARFWTKFTMTSSQKDKLVHVQCTCIHTHVHVCFIYIATCTIIHVYAFWGHIIWWIWHTVDSYINSISFSLIFSAPFRTRTSQTSTSVAEGWKTCSSASHTHLPRPWSWGGGEGAGSGPATENTARTFQTGKGQIGCT